MKKRIVLFSVLALVGLLVAGGTMAWFTSNPAAVTNTFTAGTVDITLNENGFVNLDNVNPGDTHDKEVTVISNGSKATYVRVKLTPAWSNLVDGEDLPEIDPSNYEIGPDWVAGTTDLDGGTWYYYKHIMNGGETTPLITEVVFDGPSMGNAYQGATFSLEVEAQAVQASHNAYMDAWGLLSLPGDVEGWIAP